MSLFHSFILMQRICCPKKNQFIDLQKCQHIYFKSLANPEKVSMIKSKNQRLFLWNNQYQFLQMNKDEISEYKHGL